jgi:hypothetical protein
MNICMPQEHEMVFVVPHQLPIPTRITLRFACLAFPTLHYRSIRTTYFHLPSKFRYKELITSTLTLACFAWKFATETLVLKM